jgi:signal transduction histidine kinase
LLSNSIKVIDDKRDGVISITGENKEIKSDINNDDNKYIVISRKDNSTGIDENIMPNLFSKFQTKSFHGMVLGLYIFKSIFEAHGGSTWAENNEEGNGATFSCSLPISVNNYC